MTLELYSWIGNVILSGLKDLKPVQVNLDYFVTFDIYRGNQLKELNEAFDKMPGAKKQPFLFLASQGNQIKEIKSESEVINQQVKHEGI